VLPVEPGPGVNGRQGGADDRRAGDADTLRDLLD
jgi:hypothetical protein